MDWLTEYFEIILPVALVLLFLFQRMFVREEEHGPMPPESETEEEARRIQEEIRRKIIARQQGRTVEEGPVTYQEPGQQPATFPRRQEQRPPPLVQQQRQPQAPPRPRPVARQVEAGESASAGRDFQAELRVQRQRLREAQDAKEAALHRTGGRGVRRKSRQTVGTRRTSGGLRAQLLDDLSTPENMKRAFLLKEIVDRPVGLRDRPDVFSNWG